MCVSIFSSLGGLPKGGGSHSGVAHFFLFLLLAGIATIGIGVWWSQVACCWRFNCLCRVADPVLSAAELYRAYHCCEIVRSACNLYHYGNCSMRERRRRLKSRRLCRPPLRRWWGSSAPSSCGAETSSQVCCAALHAVCGLCVQATPPTEGAAHAGVLITGSVSRCRSQRCFRGVRSLLPAACR